MRLNSEVCAKGFCWICFESQELLMYETQVHDRKEDRLCCCGRDGSKQLVMDESELKQMVVTMASCNGLK
ncbi:hypothetical protein C5167_027523 [Papaver somniferum]|nr:hypothetical protein C5167_027523 [Papaver somniferum]